MMTREEHLEWAKGRARECLKRGQVQEAIVSMMSDLRKHADWSEVPWVNALGLMAAQDGSRHAAEKFIEGFN